MKIKPFSIDVSEEVLNDIRKRLNQTRWPREVPKGGGWNYGVDMAYLMEIANYWINKYD